MKNFIQFLVLSTGLSVSMVQADEGFLNWDYALEQCKTTVAAECMIQVYCGINMAPNAVLPYITEVQFDAGPVIISITDDDYIQCQITASNKDGVSPLSKRVAGTYISKIPKPVEVLEFTF